MGGFEPGAYEVEGTVFGGKFRSHLVRNEEMALADQRALTDRLVGHFGIDPVTCVRTRHTNGPLENSHANTETRTITYGALAGPAYVCHEVAHILTGKQGGHGPVWQANYVAGVRVVLGDWHGARLEKAFAKFEADKARNIARGAAKRGKRRAALKNGPRVGTVARTGTLRTKQVGKTTATWGKNYTMVLAIRYGTNKGGYWQLTAYDQNVVGRTARYNEEWELLAEGNNPTIRPLFVEKQVLDQGRGVGVGPRLVRELRVPMSDDEVRERRLHDAGHAGMPTSTPDTSL